MNIQVVISDIEQCIEYLQKFEKDLRRIDYGDWEKRFRIETDKLVDRNNKISSYRLENFIGMQIFVSDCPILCSSNYYYASSFYYAFRGYVNQLLGRYRASHRTSVEGLKIITNNKLLDLLDQYPMPSAGNPFAIKSKGRAFSLRYLRHIYFLGLYKKYLKEKMADEFTILDLGSSYGIFSSLLKKERPKSHHILVDLPGQLILAHYYLSTLFPDAKIAGFKEVGLQKSINKEFISKYDFILVPTSMYEFLEANTVDLYTNFVSLTEMNREWFDKYLTSDVFKTAKYFFTVNRYDAYPTYKSGVTVLDYPLNDYKKMYMRTSDFLKYYYKSQWIFGTKRISLPSQVFEFIGEINNKDGQADNIYKKEEVSHG